MAETTDEKLTRLRAEAAAQAPAPETTDEKLTRLRAEADAAPVNTSEDIIVDEPASETPSVVSRFLHKTVGDVSPTGIQKLNAANPALNIKYSDKAEGVVYQPKSETNKSVWHSLDPSLAPWNQSLGENLQDVGDLAYDIPAGIAQGAATAAGFLGGSRLGLGKAGGSAASVAAGEAARQLKGYLGEKTGYGEPVKNWGLDMAVPAAVNAVAPSVFGHGVTQGAAEKFLGGSRPALQRALDMGTGVLNKGDAVTPALIKEGASELVKASGSVPVKVLKSIPGRLVGDAVDWATEKVSNGYVNTLRNAGVNIPDWKPSYTRLDLLKYTKGHESNIGTATIDLLSDADQRIGASMARRYQGPLSKVTTKSVDLSAVLGRLRSKFHAIPMSEAPNQAQLDLMNTIEDFATKHFQLPDEVVGVSGGQQMVAETSPLVTPADALKKLVLAGDDLEANLAGKGMDPEIYAIRDIIRDEKSAIYDTVLSKDPKLRADYAEFKGLQKELSKYNTPVKAASAMENVGNKNNKNRVLLDIFKRADGLVAKTLSKGEEPPPSLYENAKQAFVTKTFGDPNMFMAGGSGVTSTTKTNTLGALGAGIGTGMAGAAGAPAAVVLGAGRAGHVAGSIATSPWAVLNALKVAEHPTVKYPAQAAGWLVRELAKKNKFGTDAVINNTVRRPDRSPWDTQGDE